MRHIEKLKKIFTCCGKECSADTNGKALDELLTLAENGELGGGGSDNVLKINLTVGSDYYSTDFAPQDLSVLGKSLYGGWIIDSIEGIVSDFTEYVESAFRFKSDLKIECNSDFISIRNDLYAINISHDASETHDGEQIELIISHG